MPQQQLNIQDQEISDEFNSKPKTEYPREKIPDDSYDSVCTKVELRLVRNKNKNLLEPKFILQFKIGEKELPCFLNPTVLKESGKYKASNMYSALVALDLYKEYSKARKEGELKTLQQFQLWLSTNFVGKSFRVNVSVANPNSPESERYSCVSKILRFLS